MFVIDYRNDKVYVEGRLNNDLFKSLKSFGYQSRKGEVYCTYDVYLNTKHLLEPKYESKKLLDFLETLTIDKDKIETYLSKYSPYKLYDFQREFVYWFNDPKKTRVACINASEPGLGKTCMSLAAVFADNPKAQLIILCPVNTHGVWKEHLKSFQYELPISSEFNPCNDMGALIITYDSVPPLLEEGNNKKDNLENFFSKIPKGVVIIADEFHKCRNAKAHRTKRFKALFKHVTYKGGKCIALTGTPILNREKDLQTLLTNLDLFKISFGNAETFYNLFGGEFDYARGYVQWFPNKRKPDEIQSRLKNIIFRKLKSEVQTNLPDIIEKIIPVTPHKKTNAKILNEIASKYEAKEILSGKLSSIEFTKYSKARQALSLEKLDYAIEIVENYEEMEKPLIVFSDFTDPIEKIGKRKGWAYINGTVNAKKREQIANDFNKGLS